MYLYVYNHMSMYICTVTRYRYTKDNDQSHTRNMVPLSGAIFVFLSRSDASNATLHKE